jgi:hypothetical protein
VKTSRTNGVLVAIAAAILVSACGATISPRTTASALPSAVSATMSPIPTEASSERSSEEPQPPTADPGVEVEFELPTPDCPPQPGPVVIPDVRVSIGDGPGIIATRGGTTFSTCTTLSVADVTGDAPLRWLSAARDDRFRLEVQNGWRIIRIEGYDHPAVGDGGNVDSPIDLPDGPSSVEVPVPQRDGDATAGWTLWLVRVDRRAVGRLDVQIGVHLP